jgi:hypothetical protein
MGRISWRARRSLIATHRALGLTAAIFVVVLSLTGLLLNHPERFDFLASPLHSEAVLRWYGQTPEGELSSFLAGDNSASSLDRGIYVDDHYLTSSDTPLIGFVGLRDIFALATSETIWLVAGDPDGGRPRIVDRMDSASLPGRLLQIGSNSSGNLLAQTEEGIFRAAADFLSWEVSEASAVEWNERGDVSPEVRSAILRQFGGEGLLWSRLITDVHTGRIFGRFGAVLMDAAAVVLLVLVATGLTVARTGKNPS